MRFLQIALLCATLASPAAFAHALDVAALEVTAEGVAVRASLDLSVEIAEPLAAIGKLRTPEVVSANAVALFRATLGSGTLEASGAPCAAGPPTALLDGVRIRIAALFTCQREANDLRWTFPFVDAASLDYRVLVKAVLAGEERNFILEPGSSTLRVSGQVTRSFGAFVSMGLRHIGAHPDEWRDVNGVHFPAGIDHILFLLALILAGGGLWRTLGTVTGFTVGHSITLAIATLGLVSVPGKPVEIAIAVSIVYVALRDVFAKEPSKHGFAIAAAFGLVHGFGFASALTELHLSRAGLASALVGFNLGVELGQATIVALLAPLVIWLRRRAWFRSYGTRALGSAIAAAGLYWLVQRILA